jgi:peptide-methionine (S)-S-oxide reductase
MTDHDAQNFTEGSSIQSTSPMLATLGGGCFWCLEAIYQQVKGVLSVESGYAGGHTPKPDYESVCSGQTGYAEVVRIQFDPAMISYERLLEIFFAIHDPTTLNRQGHDVGTQYRSVIYFHDSDQEIQAKGVMERLNAPEFYDGQIVTELSPLPEYFKAEEYHQNYFNQHPYQGYCAFVISPKLSKFREQFASLLGG